MIGNKGSISKYPPTATETLEGLVSPETQGLAGNKTLKGESAVSGKVLILKNSLDDLIAQFFNDGRIILGNGTAMGGSDFLRFYNSSGDLKLRAYNDYFLFGKSTATISNNGTGGLTILGNTGVDIICGNANAGRLQFDNGKVNTVPITSNLDFYSFKRNYALLGNDNKTVTILNLENEIDFSVTGANNFVKAIFINPTLTNVNQLINEFIAFQSVKGGVFVNTSTPENSAVLQADSTEQGSLPFPRMTEAQKNAITSPAVGLHIYQTDGTEGVYVNKSTGWAFAY